MSLIGINTRMAQDAICDDNVIIDNQNTAIAPSKDNTFHQGKDISNRWFSRKTESATWKEADARLHGCAKHHGPYKKYCIIECDGIYQAFEANLINIRVRETMNNPKTVLGQLVIFSSNSLQLIGLELMRLQGKPKKECHISARNIIELRMGKNVYSMNVSIIHHHNIFPLTSEHSSENNTRVKSINSIQLFVMP